MEKIEIKTFTLEDALKNKGRFECNFVIIKIWLKKLVYDAT